MCVYVTYMCVYVMRAACACNVCVCVYCDVRVCVMRGACTCNVAMTYVCV